MKIKFKKLMSSEIAILMVLILLCIVATIVTPVFATSKNILSVLQRTATTGIVAIGMTFVIGTGGIDLSVGGQMTIIGIAAALMFGKGMPMGIILLLMICMGIAMGLINGILISYLKIVPIMATLAMQLITFGFSLYITEGRQFQINEDAFRFFGLGKIIEIPTPIWIFALVAVIAMLILKKFTIGRKILAVGSNTKGAWYAGINVRMVTITGYVIAGISAAISSVIMTSKLMSASATVGDGMEMDAIAAVVIGGTSMEGGNGFIIGTVAGALIITVITNWMTLQDINPYLREVVKGVIIIIALLIDNIRRGKLKKNDMAG